MAADGYASGSRRGIADRGTVAEPPPATAASNCSCASRRPGRPGKSAAELEAFLINFVVEQTGYPAEVVDLDADLEADLGIDSIKKAQLFGELQEYFDIAPWEPAARRAEAFRSTTLPRCGTYSTFLSNRNRVQPPRRASTRLLPRLIRRRPWQLYHPTSAGHCCLRADTRASNAPDCHRKRCCRASKRTGSVPDQLRRRADRLSGRSGRPRCRSGSRSGNRQHQKGSALRRAARIFRYQSPERPAARRAERFRSTTLPRYGTCSIS